MRYFRLEPPSPGHAYEEMDASGATRTVFSWNYPSRDPILTHVRFFVVPAPFAERLRKRELSGYALAEVDTRSGEAPLFVPVLRLVVDGTAGADDFGMQTKTTLVVSERVVDEMRAYGMSECKLQDYDPDYRVPTPEELLRRLRERNKR
jgi:hypothetical protein